MLQSIANYLAENVPNESVEITDNDILIIAMAKELDILKDLNIIQYKKKSFVNTAICPQSNGKLSIFINHIGFKEAKDNGYILLVINGYTPNLIAGLSKIGISNSAGFKTIDFRDSSKVKDYKNN